jgi:DNA-binding SARP family transcriptional activator
MTSVRGAGWRRLVLLGGFEYLCGETPVRVPPVAQHVLAFLGVHDGRVSRLVMAVALWPGSDDRRAAANLRSVLWRLPEPCRDTVVTTNGVIELASDISCDVWEMTEYARWLIGTDSPPAPASLSIGYFLNDLLPAWYEDWVLAERERLTQLRMHALEALSRRLTAAARFAEAIDAGLAAVAAEPLRETAHRRLIEAHLAEGNVTEAVRQYDQYRALLAESLGARPTDELAALIESAIHM